MVEKDIREAFFDQLCELASVDKNIVIITNDMDVFSLIKFKQNYPNQFINIGVAEQNMVNVAAGLASCGKKVVIFGISSFVIFRCYEQIKFNISSMKLPIIIVGVGAGFSFEFDGPTHHAVQDIAVMRAMPEFVILNPCDSIVAQKCVSYALNMSKPTYVRLDKGVFRQIYNEDDKIDKGFKIIRPIDDVNIICSGTIVDTCMEAADLLSKDNLTIGVIDITRLKPINREIIDRLNLYSEYNISVEEHSIIGGLGSSLMESGLKSLKMVGVSDDQFLNYGTRQWINKQYKLDARSIANYAECRL